MANFYPSIVLFVPHQKPNVYHFLDRPRNNPAKSWTKYRLICVVHCQSLPLMAANILSLILTHIPDTGGPTSSPPRPNNVKFLFNFATNSNDSLIEKSRFFFLIMAGNTSQTVSKRTWPTKASNIKPPFRTALHKMASQNGQMEQC